MLHQKLLLIFSFLFICTFVKGQDRVFFSSFSPETWEIYLSKDDGKTFHALTDHPGLDYDAVFSPDEKWVVFTSERNGLPQLFVMPVDKSQKPRLLVNSGSFQDQATFSPDGTKLAFVASHEGNAEIYLIDFLPDSTQAITKAKNITMDPGGDFRPSFSPDGKYLAFSSDRAHPIRPHPVFPFAMDRKGDIYKVNLETGSLERLTDKAFWDGSPIWSKDGSQIIFYSERSNKQPTIFRMNSDGSQIEQISDSTHLAISPVVISDSQFSYTTLDLKKDRIFNLKKDLNSGETDTLYQGELDLFNLNRSKSGLWLAHGAITAKEMQQNLGGFAGKLIGDGFPRIFDEDSLNLELTAIRRAFAAPPDPNGPFLVFDYFDQSNPSKIFIDAATVWFWPALILVICVIGMFIRGIFLGIYHRKRLSFWKYLLAGFSILIGFVFVMGVFLNFFLVNMDSFDLLLPFALGVGVLLGIIAFWMRWKKNQWKTKKPFVSGLFAYLFIGFSMLAVLMLYLGFFSANLFQPRAEIFRVNYQTLDSESIFKLEPNYGVHPAYSSVIDLKYTPDGKGLVITTGPFRGGKGSKATVWKYDFDQKSQTKITDSNWNNGFGDFSSSNERFVFRSDRDGTMDIFVQEGGALMNLTKNDSRENFPVISPDGNKIVFVSDKNGKEVGDGVKTMDLYLIQRMGEGWSEAEQLTFSKSQTGHPHFSPDGNWIIYTTEEYGINDEQPISQSFIFSPQMYGEIVALRLNDRKKIKITHNKWEEGAPLWVKGLD